MRKKLYIGEKKGYLAFKRAMSEVSKYATGVSEDTPFITPQGKIVYLGLNHKQQQIYWTAAGNSIPILKQALADFWSLLNDCISNWDVVEVSEEELK